MTETQQVFRYWFVNCVGCRNPIPLYAEPVERPEMAASAECQPASERGYFRAWCMECGREYPYLAEAMISTDEPPRDKHHREVEFTRFRQRLQVKRAHA